MSGSYDIVIAGGGMVGASLAVALKNTSYRVAMLEAAPLSTRQPPGYDDRGLALSLSSRRILAALDVWSRLSPAPCPIRSVHVSDQGHFGKVRMQAAEMGLEALGYVVVARELGITLYECLEQADNIDVIRPARVSEFQQNAESAELVYTQAGQTHSLRCKLLVIADGTASELRQQLRITARLHEYEQLAVVSNVTFEKSHGNIAFERFTAQGPVALLPLHDDRCVLIHTISTAEAERFLEADDRVFCAAVENSLSYRLGRIKRTGSRRSYPLQQLQVDKQYDGRALLLGNAVHTLHPNGAQGFNLGLRDVAGLTEHILAEENSVKDPGSPGLLASYVSSRVNDQISTSRFSHSMTEWFYNEEIGKTLIRNTAMTAIDLIKPLKLHLMRKGMGLTGLQPEMVRD